MSDPDGPASSGGESPVSRRAPRTSCARGRVQRSPSSVRHTEHHAKRKTAVERATLRVAKAVGLVRPLRKKPLPKDPVESAKAAHCRYVDDSGPGIRRVKSGKSWKLVSPQGKPIRDRDIHARVKSLVIPPRVDRGMDLPRRRRSHPGNGP
jgi:hypothetical protein